MSDIEACIERAREALHEQNAKEALRILKPFKKSLKTKNGSNVLLLQTFANAYLEDGQLEKAYPLLSRACEADVEGTQGGSEKFFTLGQVAGGQFGINILLQGVENVSREAGDNLNQEQIGKIVSGLLSMVEIWMTDLCMEETAEAQSEELVNKAMEISDGVSPEVWSTLGSIRISQQRYKEAVDAFIQSWTFFEMRKQEIEKSLNDADGSTYEDYVQLLQPLLTLAKMCIEMGLYDISLKIVSAIKDIDEDNLEAYYLEGFTYYMISKMEMFKNTNPTANVTAENIFEFNQHFKEVPLSLNNESISEVVHEARLALSFASKIGGNCDATDEVIYELLMGTKELLEELGGPLNDKELMKARKGEAEDDNDNAEFDLDNIGDED